MITSLVRLNNVDFTVSRLDRRILDNVFSEKHPIPPTKKIVVWGGMLEDAYVYDDPTYLKELREYNSLVYMNERGLFLSAISYNQEDIFRIVDKELYSLTNDVLASALSEDQINTLFNEVLYLSTVTMSGIAKAYNMFRVTRFEDEITSIAMPPSDVQYSHIYRDRLVAKAQGYRWNEFCELSGQEQSSEVAVSDIQGILSYLKEKADGK